MPGIQPDMVGRVAVEDPPHVTHDHVPRSQFRPRVRPDHEPLAGVVP